MANGAKVVIADVWRRYGGVAAVAGVTIDVSAGEFLSLLGPSGSGKTTLLMILAGFEQADSGRVLIGDADMTRTPPNRRELAMVFQRYALFPHMTVAENIAFPLRMRRVERAAQRERVARALDMVKLGGFADRRPAQLSGGQQQRVALARAIVFEPPVILMDEPLGALDKKLRQHMQIELKQLQERLGCTVIYVTHDQEEALTMSDRVAVMDHGKLMQIGAPRELYARPANAFVADFIGDMNFVLARVAGLEGEAVRLDGPGGPIAGVARVPFAIGAPARAAIRPEDVAVGRVVRGEPAGLPATVGQVVFNGARTMLLLQLEDGSTLRADVAASDRRFSAGEAVRISWTPESAHVFEAAP